MVGTVVIDAHAGAHHTAELRRDVLAGLTASPKWLPSRWLYDERGSALFEHITTLPEYYPTRTEHRVLAECAVEFAATASGLDTLVELGCGSSEKTWLLIDALRAAGTLRRFVPLDVSAPALARLAAAIAARYPGLAVHGVVGDLTRRLAVLPAAPGGRAVAFLGGTIGNLVRRERAALLAELRTVLGVGEPLLLGLGLVTDPAVVVPAYADAAGVTAEFNRNVLRRLNREVGADFDLDAFDHVALWDERNEWIEMRLRARRALRVHLAALGLQVAFAAGEELRTEVSARFRRPGLAAELAVAGFRIRHWWTDPAQRCAVVVAV